MSTERLKESTFSAYNYQTCSKNLDRNFPPLLNMISLLLLLCIPCFTLSLSSPLSNETDYLSLLDFKSSLTNSEHVLGNNWTTNTPFCSWIGVTCSNRGQRMTQLILSNMGLEGEISQSIANLSSLVTLNLSNNHLTGSIPPSISNLPSLRVLILSNNSLSGSLPLLGRGESIRLSSELQVIDVARNQLSGEIPSNLCHFAELKTLRISFNNLTGKMPNNIGCLSKLEGLYMYRNRINGNIPPSLGNISTLRVLECTENSIGGLVPPELGKLTKLEWLNFGFNNLTGPIPPEVFNLSSLKMMSFDTNKLWGRIPAAAGLQLPNLEALYLANNSLHGVIPLSITNASKLSRIELSINMFDGQVPSNLGDLKELTVLALHDNQLTNEVGDQELGFFSSLVECRSLEVIDVSKNLFVGSLPSSIQNLSKSLDWFNLDGNGVYGSIPAGIGNFSSMITLHLRNNFFTGTIPVEMGNLNMLQRLYLDANRLSGRIPNELCNLVNIGEMSISENNLSGSIPSCIGNLRRVQVLDLSNNRLVSTMPSGLWELGLLKLNLSKNLIQGRLYSDMEKLQGIEEIDLSSNRFSGNIPNSVGELKNLVLLNLSSNLLNGSIPTSFGDLLSLEVLDLSWNNLTGSIPTSLENIPHLREINFSYNQLQGEIPQGGIFLNSSHGAFEGNEDLCAMTLLGFPLCRTHSNSHWSRTKKLIIRIMISVIVLVLLLVASLSFWIIKRRRRRRVTQEDVELAEMNGPKKIPYLDILKGTDNFSEANLLGVGSSGSVFKAILPDGEVVVAVKVLNLDNDEGKKRFDKECEVLKQIRHRNLVQVITTCSNDMVKAIVLPYMSNGNLDNWLHKEEGPFLDFHERIRVMLDVAMAMGYLHHGHEFPVVHCDLKPSNVLLDADMVAHVSDFGISKIFYGEKLDVQTETLGTVGYIAPEYGSQGIVSTAGDVYSYGIMLMEALVGRSPTDELFSDNLSMRQWVKEAYPNSLREIIDATLLQENEFIRSYVYIQSLIELSLSCSTEGPEERIDMQEVVIRLGKIKKSLLLK